MARTTEAAVRGIILRIDSTLTDVTPYIDAANNLVTQHCSTLDDDTAELVERWLAAHFLVMNNERIESEEVRRIRRSFQHKLDLGLNQSKYGQQAMLLDYSGGLASWQAKVQKGTAGGGGAIFWLGKDETEA